MEEEIRDVLRRTGSLCRRELFFSESAQLDLSQTVQTLCRHVGLEEYWSTYYYCVRELVSNAQKSLLKRSFFAKKGLDVMNSKHYQGEIVHFKNWLEKSREGREILEKEGAFIEIVFQYAQGKLNLDVLHPGELTKEEQARIDKRLQFIAVSEQLADIQQDIYDNQEGAGLGLAMVGFIMKKFGYQKDALRLNSNKGMISVTLSLSPEHLQTDCLYEVNRQLIEAVDTLPDLPENVQLLQRLLNKQEPDFRRIAEVIERDHSLAANLLKLANSVKISPVSRIISVERAIVMLGVKGLEQLVISIAVEKLLNLRRKKQLWEHSCDCACLTQMLLEYKSSNRDLFSLGYVAGLLHDIGDVILLNNAKPIYDLFKELQQIHPNATAKTLKFVQSGYSHVELGSLLAKKWRFPKALQQVIKYHHDPLKAPASVRYLAATVYCADIFLSYKQEDIPEIHLFNPAFKLLGLESDEQIYTMRNMMFMRLESKEGS